jgi:hypothetical protein
MTAAASAKKRREKDLKLNCTTPSFYVCDVGNLLANFIETPIVQLGDANEDLLARHSFLAPADRSESDSHSLIISMIVYKISNLQVRCGVWTLGGRLGWTDGYVHCFI